MTQPYSRDEKPFRICDLLFISCELLITAIILTYSFINVKYLFALFLTFYLFLLFTFTPIKNKRNNAEILHHSSYKFTYS